MDKQKNKERHGKDDVKLPSSEPREDKSSTNESPVIEEHRKKPSAGNTPETGPGGE
jgi:hypothetical protein